MRGLIALALFAALQTPPPEAWQQANHATRRLVPSDFSELPPSVRVELEQRGCRIPQTWSSEVRGNVVRGRFTDRSIEDWAVLCSRDRVSSILVFLNANPKAVASLAERPDRDFLQVVAPGAIGFSREITVATPEDVRTHYEWYATVDPPVLTHDAIDDAFAEKGSTVWYRQGDRWLRLLGSN